MTRTHSDIPLVTSGPPFAELDVVGRWNANAPHRMVELSRSTDRSYEALTKIVMDRVAEHAVTRRTKRFKILDVGCGLGFLSRSLAAAGHKVDAIDPSEASIELARQRSKDVRFHVCTLEAFPRSRTYDVIVANMTLHCVAQLPAFMEAAAALLNPAGVFIATIPNPDSYLQRRSDVRLDMVDLGQEYTFEIPFRIHDHQPHPAEVYYFHRPLKTYAAAARGAALKFDDYQTPQQIGLGKPQDIAVLVLRHQPNQAES